MRSTSRPAMAGILLLGCLPLRAEQPLLVFGGEIQVQIEAGVVAVPQQAVQVMPAIPLQVAEVRPVPVEPAKVEAAAVEAAQRDARILGWVLERGLQALAAPVANGPAGVVLDRQRRVQIEQQAKQMERFFQPMLASELELIRQACGSLEPDARRKLLAAGRGAVKTAAREFATRQLTGGLGQDSFDPRDEIRRPLSMLLEGLAAPAEFAAYEAEQQARAVRRAEAARVMIVTKLDRQLDLTNGQRRAIEADLEQQWQADWLRSLGQQAGLINGFPAAPDYAAVCIVPHLRPEQEAAWADWCRAAGERLIGRHHGINLDNQGLQTIDAWWPGADQ